MELVYAAIAIGILIAARYWLDQWTAKNTIPLLSSAYQHKSEIRHWIDMDCDECARG